MEPYNLSSGAVAEQLGVTRETLRLWVRDQRLRAFETPGGHLRFRQSDVDQFVAAHFSGEGAS